MHLHVEAWLDSATVEDLRAGGDATRALPADPASALRIARTIRHPWYRCQAVAGVAQAQRSAAARQTLLEESLAAAYRQRAPNRVASAAYWPLQQLVATNPAFAKGAVSRLLSTVALESHGLRKLDGLAHLLAAVLPDADLRSMVMPSFAAAAAASRGWRAERIVVFSAFALAEHDHEAAMVLLRSRSPNRFAGRALAAIEKQRSVGG